jgi:hypothetical protein
VAFTLGVAPECGVDGRRFSAGGAVLAGSCEGSSTTSASELSWWITWDTTRSVTSAEGRRLVETLGQAKGTAHRLLEDIVQLRALALSDRWDHAMHLVLDPLKKSVRPPTEAVS